MARDARIRLVPLTQALTRSKPSATAAAIAGSVDLGIELRERDEPPVDAAPLVVRVERGRSSSGAPPSSVRIQGSSAVGSGSPPSSSRSRAIASRRVVGDAGSSSHARVGSSIAGVEVAARAAPDGLTVRRYPATGYMAGIVSETRTFAPPARTGQPLARATAASSESALMTE